MMTLAIFKVLVFGFSLTFTAAAIGQTCRAAITKEGTVTYIPFVIGWTIFYALYVFGG